MNRRLVRCSRLAMLLMAGSLPCAPSYALQVPGVTAGDSASRKGTGPNAALYVQGKKSYSQTDYLGAIDALKRFAAVASVAELGDTYSYLGDAYSAIKDYVNAIPAYTKYILAHPGDKIDGSLKGRGLAYLMLKRNVEAAADYKAYRALHKDDPHQAVSDGDGIFGAGHAISPEELVRQLKDAVTKDPCNLLLRTSLAKMEIEVKDYSGALEQYMAILKSNPDNSAAIYNRGVTYGLLHNPAQAAADFTAYTKLKPDDAAGWNNLGIHLALLKDYSGSIAAFTRCLAEIPPHPGKPLPPEFEEVYKNRGIDYFNIQDWKNVQADFSKYLSTHPGDETLKDYLRQVISGPGPDQAIELKAVVSKAPGLSDPNAWFNLGVAHLARKRYEDATVAFARSNELKADPQTLFNLALSFYNLGQAGNTAAYAQAEQHATTALALKPDYADAVLVRADIELAERKSAAAKADYQRYVGMSGVSAENKAYAEKQMAALP